MSAPLGALIASGGHHRVTVATHVVSGGHPLALVAASGPARRIYPAARPFPRGRLSLSAPAEAPARPMLRSARGPWVYPADDRVRRF